MKIKRAIKNIRLLKERDKLIRIAYYDDGFFIEEIGDIFRMGKSAIGKVVFESKVGIKK